MKDRIVAFVDILGFKHLTSELQEKSLLEVISPLYFAELSNNEQKKIHQEVGLSKFHSTEVTFFSDSLVISCEPSQISNLITQVRHISESFIEYGLFLRGGIAQGRLYHNDRVVFGPAMNEAYTLESQYAIYPRIIISDEVHYSIKTGTEPAVSAEEYRALGGLSKVNEDLKTVNNITRDEDGFYYVNPFPRSVALTPHIMNLGINSVDDFRRHLKRSIEQNLQKYWSNKKIFTKYFWLASKFNRQFMNNADIAVIETGE